MSSAGHTVVWPRRKPLPPSALGELKVAEVAGGGPGQSCGPSSGGLEILGPPSGDSRQPKLSFPSTCVVDDGKEAVVDDGKEVVMETARDASKRLVRRAVSSGRLARIGQTWRKSVAKAHDLSLLFENARTASSSTRRAALGAPSA
ncbi:uncharacterized protein PG986_001764 [Apiospora aurea]|uniref:Uncharacterized protein n=1 Tax=Apiospora aurea TaxID=335848 RepID=A0ABR1QYF5_9PEZI